MTFLTNFPKMYKITRNTHFHILPELLVALTNEHRQKGFFYHLAQESTVGNLVTLSQLWLPPLAKY